MSFNVPTTRTEVNSIEFDPKTKAAAIDLPTLTRTIKLEDTEGKLPKCAPIEHYRLIETILEMGNRYTPYEAKVLPINIREGNVRRIRWADKKVACPVENYLVERMMAKIQFNDVMFPGNSEAEGSMSVAVALSERGIQVAFGHNVFACDNLNVFGEYMFSTFGNYKHKMEFYKGMQLLETWLKEFEPAKQLNKSRIMELQTIDVTEPKRQQLIGKLFERAVRVNNNDKSVVAPLNQAECASLIRAGYDRLIKNDGTITGWELTNWATSVLKPTSGDMVTLIESNRQINEFIYQELTDIDYEMA